MSHSRGPEPEERQADEASDQVPPPGPVPDSPRPANIPRARLAIVGAVSVAVLAAAGALLVDRLAGPAVSDTTAITVYPSMGGFKPNALTVKAGQTVRIDLVNKDGPFHSDGGGKHAFHLDELDVHAVVEPEADLVVEFRAPDAPGEYPFYCDICCGGKANPSMWGTLTVTS